MATEGTMLATIESWAKKQPYAPALHDRREDGAGASTTWSGYWRELRRIGQGLLPLARDPPDRAAPATVDRTVSRWRVVAGTKPCRGWTSRGDAVATR